MENYDDEALKDEPIVLPSVTVKALLASCDPTPMKDEQTGETVKAAKVVLMAVMSKEDYQNLWDWATVNGELLIEVSPVQPMNASLMQPAEDMR